MTSMIAHFKNIVRKNKQQHTSLYLGWLRLRSIWYTSLKYTCKCPAMILAHTPCIKARALRRSPLQRVKRHTKSMNYILDKNLFITALIRKGEGSTLGKKQLKD